MRSTKRNGRSRAGAAAPSKRRALGRVGVAVAATALLATALLAESASAITGTYRVALLRPTYSDAAAPLYSVSELQAAAAEIESFYDRMSFGRLDLEVRVGDAPGAGSVSSADNGTTLAEGAADAAVRNGFNMDGIQAIGVITPGCGRDVYGGLFDLNTANVSGRYAVTRLFDENGCVDRSNTPGPARVEWGAWAHEIGHAVQDAEPASWADHPAAYADPHSLMDSCLPCGVNVYGLVMPRLGTKPVFPGFLEESKVEEVPPPTGADTSRTVVLSPLYDASGTPKGIRIPVGSMMVDGRRVDHRYYLVEARRRVGADSLGTSSPPRLEREGVHINLVDESREPPVQPIWICDQQSPGCIRDANDPRIGNCRRQDPPNNPAYCYPAALWQPGQVFRDAANGVTIRVDAATGNGYTVTVDRNPPQPRPDVYLTPWRTPPMNTSETVDIWVDSSCNGYEEDVGSAGLRHGRRSDGTVIGNGDDVCATQFNRLYAVVRNGGDAPARNVRVRFRASTPINPLVGESRSTSVVGTATAARFPALRELAPGATATVWVAWRPTVRTRTIGRYRASNANVQVQVDRVEGELITSNQDGIDEAESFTHVEVVRTGQEYFSRRPRIDLIVPRPAGPDPRAVSFVDRSDASMVKGSALELARGQNEFPVGKKRVQLPLSLEVSPGIGIGRSLVHDVGVRAQTVLTNPAITAGPFPWADAGHSALTDVGAFGLSLETLDPSSLSVKARRLRGGRVRVTGVLRPAAAAVVGLEFGRVGQRPRLVVTRTRKGGTFSRILTGLRGRWQVRALWQGDDDSASASSRLVTGR